MKKYANDWKNFKNMDASNMEIFTHIEQKVKAGVDMTGHYVPDEIVEKIRLWASNRFQPVSRTIDGLVKIPRALRVLLKVQTFHKNYSEQELDDIIDEKFNIICGAQIMDKSTWRESEDYQQYVDDFLLLLRKYGQWMKLCYQKKVSGGKWVGVLLRKNRVTNVIEEEYQVNIFGKFDVMGQGKPAHQSFMTQFLDGSIVEAIDCNQAGILAYFTFTPNILHEFVLNSVLKIVGFPEYIFTEEWSLAGYSAAFTERVFGTMIQRSWALMGMRMHYGHPDFICAKWVMFTMGMRYACFFFVSNLQLFHNSKLSYVSEDVFSGFDTILNGGQIGFVEYFIVGKARDVCLFSTSKFNRKISGGAAQTACSQYLHEVMTSWHFTICEKLTCFYTTTAHYINTVIIIGATFILFFIRVVILIMRIFQMDAMDDSSSSVWKVSCFYCCSTFLTFF